ncbi:MAG: hypothetical protein IKV99_04785 [Oscillospiraceae bacterium]|nr:hypothetical protein [Oscillospiraceae bacterium]
MKKLTAIALVLVCLAALVGCESKTVESDAVEALKTVPTLAVHCGENSVEALTGAQEWWYDNGDGSKTSFITDSLPILACKDYMKPLAIVPVTYSARQPMARLEFSVVPDRVSARSWSVDSFYGPGEPVDDGYYDTLIYTVEPEPDIDEAVVYYMEMPYEARVYEITATWDSYEHFGGEVSYGFYTEAMTLRDAEDLCGYPTVEGMGE